MSHSSELNRPKVIMVGTDPTSKGGISSVIRMYEQGQLLSKTRYLSSYSDGSAFYKITYYLRFLVAFFWALLTTPSAKIVHIHTASGASFLRKSLVILLSRLFGKKIILHVHGAEFAVAYERANPLLKAYIQNLFSLCDVIIALSSQWRRDLKKICPKGDVRVIYNPTVLRDNLVYDGKDSSDVNFIFMGRIGKRKGVYDILESVSRLKSGNAKIQLFGDGEVDTVRHLVETKGLRDKVVVHGWIDGNQKDETFRNANVLLLPSYNEGLPISVLEAMAYGIPVVATDVGGIAEAVEDGVNGYLIQPGEHQRLAECMDRLAESEELRKSMGRSGYELASQKFSLAIIVGQLEALYGELGEY